MVELDAPLVAVSGRSSPASDAPSSFAAKASAGGHSLKSPKSASVRGKPAAGQKSASPSSGPSTPLRGAGHHQKQHQLPIRGPEEEAFIEL